jgi:hypothetical protein
VTKKVRDLRSRWASMRIVVLIGIGFYAVALLAHKQGKKIQTVSVAETALPAPKTRGGATMKPELQRLQERIDLIEQTSVLPPGRQVVNDAFPDGGWYSTSPVSADTAHKFLLAGFEHYDETGLWPIISTGEDDFYNIEPMPRPSDIYGYESLPWKSQRLSFKNATWEVSRPELERLLKEVESHDLHLFLFPIDAPLSSLSVLTPVHEQGLYPLEDFRVGPFMIDQNVTYFVAPDDAPMPSHEVLETVDKLSSGDSFAAYVYNPKIFVFAWNG